MKLPFQTLCEFNIMGQYGCKSELPNKLYESFPCQIKKIGADTRSLMYGEGQGHHIMFFYTLLRTSKGEEN
jgi:hypothetical protein